MASATWTSDDSSGVQHDERELTPEQQQQQQQQKQKEAAAEYQRKLLQQKQAEEPQWKETVQALAEEEAAYKKTPEGEQAAAYEKKVLDGLAQTHPEHHAAMRRRLTPEQEHEHAELLALRRRTPEQERANAKAAAEITRTAARMDQASAADREPAKFGNGIGDLSGKAYWDYCDGQLIEQALQHTLLIDLEYPVLLGRHGGVLPCGLQHVPPAALITPANLWRVKLWNKGRNKGSVGVVVWSYPWLDWFHPDRNGAQLGRLLPFLESVLAEAKRDSPYCTVAVVIDYQCLFQKPFASEAEKRLFNGSLMNVNLWYYHPRTYVVLVTPGPPEGAEYGNTRLHKQRGWCYFELAASMVVKVSYCLLDFGGYQGAASFCGDGKWGYKPLPNTCLGEMVAGRRPPMSPAVMGERMRAGVEDGTLAFTAKADMDTVIQQYEAGLLEAINRIAAKEDWGARGLNFENLGWGDAEAAELGETLRWAAAHCDFPHGEVVVAISDGNQISDGMVAELNNDAQLKGKFRFP